MPVLTLRLGPDAEAFVRASGAPSTYLRELVEARMAEYQSARAELAEWSGPMTAAAVEATNGLLWTDDLPLRDQVAGNLSDAGWLADKHAVPLDEWARLQSMTEAEAAAVRLVAEEFWAGRPL